MGPDSGGQYENESSLARDVSRQLRRTWPVLIAATVFVMFAGGLLLLVYFQTDVDIRRLTVDPVAEVGLPAYTGIFTHVGVLMWWSAATVSLFCAALLRMASAERELSRFLLLLGLLSTVLCLDDLFLLHEEIGGWLSGFLLVGNPDARQFLEAPVFALYAALGLYCVVRFRSTVRNTDFLLLAGAFASLGLSVGIDIGFYVFPDIAYGQHRREIAADAAEDLAKLLGILLWLIYTVRTAHFGMRRLTHAADG